MPSILASPAARTPIGCCPCPNKRHATIHRASRVSRATARAMPTTSTPTQQQQAQEQHAAPPLDRRSLLTAAALLAALSSPPRPAAADEGPPAAPAAPAPTPQAPPSISKVFVVGATGQTGRRVVQQLRAAGLRVRAGVRDVRKAQSLGFALDPAGIELVACDVVEDGPE